VVSVRVLVHPDAVTTATNAANAHRIERRAYCLGGCRSMMYTIAGLVNAVVCGALLPATDRGNANAVMALPPMVLPPIAVRLLTGTAAAPGGAIAFATTAV